MTKSRLPSTLGDGPRKFIGPAVNCTGSDRVLRKGPWLSRTALIVVTPSWVELYTKYFPSGVHAPQHSLAISFPRGAFPVSNKGCKLSPAAETSHSESSWFLVAVKRSTLASGDQRGLLTMSPGKATSLRDPLPSDLTTNKSWPLE